MLKPPLEFAVFIPPDSYQCYFRASFRSDFHKPRPVSRQMPSESSYNTFGAAFHIATIVPRVFVGRVEMEQVNCAARSHRFTPLNIKAPFEGHALVTFAVEWSVSPSLRRMIARAPGKRLLTSESDWQ
jgi:hypothetical protein